MNKTTYNAMFRYLILLIVFPLLYSCQQPVQAKERPLEKRVVYAQVASHKHTKHIRKQQRKINERLQKIKERMEKRKRRRRKGGK